MFQFAATAAPLILPAPSLKNSRVRDDLMSVIRGGGRAIVYFQDKLGGEISLSPTPRSPELSFDTTLVEVTFQADAFTIERYGILELQTMDFHGSYKYAVRNLDDGLRLHGTEFPRVLQANPRWLSERVEGPNIANVFKRTFYQMMLKFQIGAHAACVGCTVAIPLSVWDSWQRHLGGPELRERGDGTWALAAPGEVLAEGRIPGWIYVFDVDAVSRVSPNPIRILKVIAASAGALSHYALIVAPHAAVGAGGSADRILDTIRRRMRGFWPELSPGTPRPRRRPDLA